MKKERIFIGLFLIIIGSLTVIDIIEDMSEGANLFHLGLEVGVAFCSFSAFIYLSYMMLKEKERAESLEKEKELLREIAGEYKQKSEAFVEGLSLHIDRTFTEWKLSRSERDIALFLLKGLSPKNIAEIRNSSEKTVRHQITSIYKKGNLGSREELSAFFLEDLLAPSN